jgi:hypothetical protein
MYHIVTEDSSLVSHMSTVALFIAFQGHLYDHKCVERFEPLFTDSSPVFEPLLS